MPTTLTRKPIQRTTRSGWTANPLTGLLVLFPAGLFGYVWWRYAINVPKWDDHALRHFLYLYEQAPTLSEKLYQFFKQHNEHRIVYDRIVTWLDYNLFGKLNYIHLMAVGNLSLVGLLAVFMAVLHRAGRSLLYALPVGFLLFNLSHWENMFWGMAALQNFSVVGWILLTFYLLSHTRYWGLAFVTAVLATITSGNGLVVWPLGFLILFFGSLNSKAGRRTVRIRQLAGWLAGAAVVITLYFTGFDKPADIAYDRPGMLALLKGWLAFLGAAAEVVPVGSSVSAGIALGGLLVVTTVGILVWTVEENHTVIGQRIRGLFSTSAVHSAKPIAPLTLFFWATALFLLGTGVIVAYARTAFGIELLMTSRYKLYSLTLLALVYAYLAGTLTPNPARWVFLAGTLVSAVFAGMTYRSFMDETIWWRHWLTTNQFNWTHPANRPDTQRDSISSRYIALAPAFYETQSGTLFGPATAPAAPITVTKTRSAFVVANETLPSLGTGDAGNYLVARSAARSYLFPVWQTTTPGLKAYVQPNRWFKSGFRADIPFVDIAAGQYQLLVLSVTPDGRGVLHPTGQTIDWAGMTTTERPKNW